MSLKKTVNKGLTAAQGMNNPPRLLCLRDAAGYLGLSTWAMREAIWKGLIPFVQFKGRKIWLDVRDLEAFISRHKRTFD